MVASIRGIRQGIPSGYLLGRASGTRGAVGLVPIGNGASATSVAGGATPGIANNGSAALTLLADAGNWTTLTAFTVGQVVYYLGGYYVCINDVPNTATTPPPSDTTDWTALYLLTSKELDDVFGNTPGDVLTRGASVWAAAAPSAAYITAVDSKFTVAGTTLELATIASGDVLGNSGASTAEPAAATLTALLDRAFGSTEGQLLQRGSSAWQVLAPGTAGQALLSGGASALNSWGAFAGATGTWSVTDQSGAGLTLTTNQGLYVQIGKFCLAVIDFTFPSTANATKALIGGLPFNVGGSDNSQNCIGINSNGPAVVLQLTASSANFYVELATATGFAGATGLTNAQLSGLRIAANLTYYTA